MTEDPRVKRLLFRANHMGMNENDILFGRFAETHLATLSSEQLDRFEALIAQNDMDLFNWVSGREPVPAEFDHDVMAMVKEFKLQ
jgi:antitoxin CptB